MCDRLARALAQPLAGSVTPALASWLSMRASV
eukprot:COSAG01_NODE_16248_length_1255_cov_1.295848_2_plen_31_part_01